MILREYVSLAPYTTFRIGGPARYFAEVVSLADLHEALAFARERSCSIFVLGGGSNILISDEGFDGLVIQLRIAGITEHEHGVSVSAGVLWDDFVLWSIEQGFTGLECMSGVPGTVGGAVVANVGAYGAQVSDTLVSVDVLDLRDIAHNALTYPNSACDFSYHDSLFGQNPGRFVVVSATFNLSRSRGVTPAYRDNRFDMARLAATLGHEPSQAEVRTAVLSMREEKGTLIMSGRVSYQCAGSFFHMPFVSKEHYEEVVARARALDPIKEELLRPWAWLQTNGTYKVAPGFLLEYTAFQKGYVRGNVGISPRHTLSIINVHNASAQEVQDLARDMQAVVQKIFNVTLEREVEYIGEKNFS
jgi:UDP-N-acetylmuramate dehydrogenase